MDRLNDSHAAPGRFAEIDGGDAKAMQPAIALYETSVNAHWLQHPGRMGLAAKHLQLFALLDGDRCDAYALVRRRRLPLVGKAMYFVERGPVYRSEAAAIELIDSLRRHVGRKAWMIEVSPFGDIEAGSALTSALAAMGFREGQAIREHYHDTVVLDLGEPIDVIRKGFRRSLKTQINRFERLGLRADYRQDPASLDDFCEMVNAMAYDRGFKPIDDSEKSWILDQLGSSMHLFVATEGDCFKGGILLVANASKSRVIYEYGGSIDQSSPPLPVGHGLHWQAIKWAKESGFQSYDFGGYDRARGGEFSINRFKLGFSKTIERLIPELRWMPAGWQRWGLERYLTWKAERTG